MSLTRHIRDKNSHIRNFLRSEFPDTRTFLADARKRLRSATTMRQAIAVPYDIIGMAIDYRIRYYFDTPSCESLTAYSAALLLSAKVNRQPLDYGLSCEVSDGVINIFDRTSGRLVAIYSVGPSGYGQMASLETTDFDLMDYMDSVSKDILARRSEKSADGSVGLSPDYAQFFTELDNVLRRTAPVKTRLSASDEGEVSRYCLALAGMEAHYRSGGVPFAQYGGTFEMGSSQLLDLVEDHWIDDLRNLSWLFYDRCRFLLKLPATLNPTFAGSADVGGADADLILDGTLLEIKTTVKSEINRDWIWQLLGYTLLDYDNAHAIDAIGIYMARQGLLFKWDLTEALSALSGQGTPDLEDLRARFRAMAQHRNRI